jgi:hypothetical protein
MPCRDGGPYEPYETRDRLATYVSNGLSGRELEAVLCAILSNDTTALDVIPAKIWKEAGVTRKKAADWWKRHQAADKARRAREEHQRAEAERQAMLKASGLNKLTHAERVALGLS